ncbi:group 1 glycosyl transferase [Trinickia dabaoshanensis]|uniref:Group 1 glycosyl transferase n=1 Tax=Trinickia dabaoshanensis TaxID=564714 RepID=A0A2N7VJ87_9BURK|nr:glycosyltransferase [Trinickia dabaoshanensis]PMS17225.1 group 1 glycosyl transferase [Trinickia dabaoshanensis]
MKPRALVIEPDLSGYRWRYVQWTIEALVEAGYECMLWTQPRHRDHPLVLAYQVSRAAVSVVVDRRRDRRLARDSAWLNAANIGFGFYAAFASVYRHVVRTGGVDLVVVPDGDDILNAVGILGSPFGSTRWMCIAMRQSFHLRDMGVQAPRRPLTQPIYKRLFYRALRGGNLSAVLTIDPTLPVWHTKFATSGPCPPVHFLEGPHPDADHVEQHEARERLGIGNERCILVYGTISDSKGIKELLYACMRRDEHPLVLIAGEQTKDVRAFIDSIGGALFSRVIVFDQFISPEREADLFCACDAVWVGYKRHYGMSGALAQAHRYGKTVIATDSGLIGWVTKRDGLGPLLRNLSARSVNAALDEAFTHGAARRAVSHWNGADAVAGDTVNHFKKIVQTTLTSG